MYDCNEFNNLAENGMALPAPLTALIKTHQLANVLCVGYTPDETVSQASSITQVSTDNLMENSFLKRVDLVALSQSALDLDDASRNAVIAKCRDQLAQKVLLELGLDDRGMTETECLALGFVRCALTERNRYYLFDLKTYKPVPDWLNPKFWANPQNWDRYRW